MEEGRLVKLLFLDIDGVLNSHQYFRRVSNHSLTIIEDMDQTVDPLAIDLLNKIIKATQAKIVITSSWRKLPDFNTVEKLQKVPQFKDMQGEIIGLTPSLGKYRSEEIEAWLKENKHLNIKSYAILDDDWDANLNHRLVKTSFETGLLDRHIEEVVKLLQ